MKAYPSGYRIEVDQVNETEWSEYLQLFDDATIYQTWSYGALRWGKNNLSHLVLKKNRKIVAVAQLRIIQVPFVKRGIAYLRWGPVWRLRSENYDIDILRQMFKSLKDEYVLRRRLLLRILPGEIDNENGEIRTMLTKEGFKFCDSITPYRTLIKDLSVSLEELRKSFRKNWRQTLSSAEKNGLEVIEGTGEELFDQALNLYNEMHARKNFVDFVNMDEFRVMQQDLPDGMKIRIMVCYYEGEPASALAWSQIGDTGIPVLAATGKRGLEKNASYLLFWEMLKCLKAYGCHCCDLGGINPERNRGGYIFKSGIAGKTGKDIHHIGQFEACQSLLSDLMCKSGDKIRDASRKIKLALNRTINAYFK